MTAPGRAPRQLAVFGELLRALAPAARRERNFPAVLQQRLGRDKRFGSRDRRLYRALAYAAVRHLPWLEADPEPDRPALALWLAGDEPALAALRPELLADWPPLPASPAEQAALLAARFGRPLTVDQLFPDWLATEAPALAAGPARDRLLTRPPLWLRLQTADPAAVDDWLARDGIPCRRHPQLPDARALLLETDVTRSPLHEAGAFEIQDLGSQLILALAAPAPGTRWLDACAGAGGKTLQLGRLLGSGHVDATDIRPAALAELRLRAARAGLANITTLAAPPPAGRTYDGVLVDAPCSGSGTWRRSPHLRWQTTAADLRQQHERQLALLSAHAARVRTGGRLVYATCSLARTENEGTVAAFLAAHPDFQVVAPADPRGCAVGEFGTAILPHVHDSDAFFVSLLARC